MPLPNGRDACRECTRYQVTHHQRRTCVDTCGMMGFGSTNFAYEDEPAHDTGYYEFARQSDVMSFLLRNFGEPLPGDHGMLGIPSMFRTAVVRQLDMSPRTLGGHTITLDIEERIDASERLRSDAEAQRILGFVDEPPPRSLPSCPSSHAHPRPMVNGGVPSVPQPRRRAIRL